VSQVVRLSRAAHSHAVSWAQVPQSSPSLRETQKKALVGVLVCALGLAAACALVAPDGRGASIHGARTSVAHRVVMSATRHFQSLDDEPAADAAPAADTAAPAAAPAAADDKKDDKKDDSDSGSHDKVCVYTL